MVAGDCGRHSPPVEPGLIPVERILALGVTAQWSGTVAVDRARPAPMNAIIWMDDQGARPMPRP